MNIYQRFRKFIYFRVEQKYYCAYHGKHPRVSVKRMEYRITYCCCEDFKSFVRSSCEKYKDGISHGRYNFDPKICSPRPHRNLPKNISRRVRKIFSPLRRKSWKWKAPYTVHSTEKFSLFSYLVIIIYNYVPVMFSTIKTPISFASEQLKTSTYGKRTNHIW